jgi:hypothetical protein
MHLKVNIGILKSLREVLSEIFRQKKLQVRIRVCGVCGVTVPRI